MMTAKEKPRVARLEARVTPDTLAMVKRAAEMQGRTVSDFVVAAAQEAARRTIAETDVVRLSLEGQRAFAEAILNPPSPTAAMSKAFALHRKLVREVR
jgi:uncharacterized protein (DUF1778 family)